MTKLPIAMTRFEFSLATPADDAALRDLLAATPLQGDISLAFARDPSYFAAAVIDGEFVQVVVARERESNSIVGMGSRAVSNSFVNGSRQAVGYLSALRIKNRFQGRAGLLARGYRYFRELHADRRAAFYLTTIAADNRRAIELLTSQRAGLPIYHPLGRFHTLTISRRTRAKIADSNLINVRTATLSDVAIARQFLREAGPRRQFFPDYEVLVGGQLSRLKGLKPENLLLAFEEDRLVGTLGVWDQRGFKQTIVADYSRRLKLCRPLYNGVAQLRGRPRLPRVGQSLDMRYAAVFVVADDRQDIADSLLAASVEALHLGVGEILALGLHERDPMLPLVRRYGGREYTTLLYLVHWPDETPDYEQLTSRVPYLELGCL